MKISVINPGRVKGSPVTREDRLEYTDYEEIFPPLTLLYTTSILKELGHELLAIDTSGFNLPFDEVKKRLKKFQPDILICRFAIDTIPSDAKIVSFVKRINPKCLTFVRCKIIADSKILREEVLKKYPIDYLVMGELEAVIPPIIEALTYQKKIINQPGLVYLKKGKVVITAKAPIIKNLDLLPFPGYQLSGGISCYQTGMQRPPFTNIFSSRGCPFNCKFCSARNTYMARGTKNVVDELEWLVNKYQLKNFYFFDDIFTIDKKRVIDICNEIKKRGLKLQWSCGTRVDCVDSKLLKKMKEAGCVFICYGIESGCQEILDRNQKGFKLDQVVKAVNQAKKAGLYVYAMFVLGLAGETKETIKRTVEFVDKIDPDYAQYCIAVPFPNTPFFDEYHKNGWITTYDWTKYNPLKYPVISTPELSDKELNNYRYWAYKKFLLRPKFWLTRLSLKNWYWNFLGAEYLLRRLITTFKKSIIR